MCYALYFVSVFVGGYFDCKNMHGVSNIKFVCTVLVASSAAATYTVNVLCCTLLLHVSAVKSWNSV
jgi:hypothetical protein